MGKLVIYGGITVGGVIGAYLPVIMVHANPLGLGSIMAGFVGSFVGLWVGYKLNQWIES